MNFPAALRRFVDLPPSERRLALHALRVVVWVRVRLTVSSFPTVDRITRDRPVRDAVGRHSAARIGAAVRRFVALPAAEQRLVLRAVALLVAVRVRLSVRSYAAVDRATRNGPRRPAVSEHSAARIGAVVARSSRWVPGASCLTQALAGRVLLAAEGYESTLRLGMARVDGRIRAHAWLEVDGIVVVGGAGHSRFSPFESVAPSTNA